MLVLHLHQLIVSSLFSVLVFSAFAQNSSSNYPCNRTCGTETVPYPFGFTDGCEIKLSCSASGERKIGDFTVHNVTANQILITLPPQCNRAVDKLQSLFGLNFAPTWRNGFLLDNCSAPINECAIPSRIVRSRVQYEECNYGGITGNNYNISCYSDEPDDSEFFEFRKVIEKGNCTSLFSSIMVDLSENGSSLNGTSPIVLNFQTVELGWWLDGGCDCHLNASCAQVKHENRSGYRCKCNNGFVGDGFVSGVGCRKVSNCSGSSILSARCHGTRVGLLIGGVIIGAVSTICVAVILYYIKRRNIIMKGRLSVKRLISEAGSPSVPFFPYKEIERATNGFSEKQTLGTGAYGTVYAGKLHNGESLAIKKIRHRDHESVEQVMNEIRLLSSVSHPNLVRLLGCCIENGEQILVYEYMPNGTLSQHLQRERGSVLPWTVRLTIAAETAHAIAHLHSAINPPIYHRDIKSSNILLDYNFSSKVADFGLSRFGMTDDSHVSTAPQGTPGYVDPQYHQNFHLSDKSDVYSFGVVLVEIITAMKVVDFSRPHSEINLAALAIERIGKGRTDEIIDPFLEPNRDAWTLSSIHKVAELAFRCLAFHRDMRPTMMEVADELEQIRNSSWAPMEDTTHMGSSVVSSCCSSCQGSEKSFNVSTSKKLSVGSTRLRGGVGLTITEEVPEMSPVSVQDPWLSEQSSPSADSLLNNVAR